MNQPIDDAEDMARKGDALGAIRALIAHVRSHPAPPPSLFQSANGPCAQHGVIMNNGRCPVCSGDVAPPPSPSDARRCFACAGAGRFGHGDGSSWAGPVVSHETCTKCGGSGEAPSEENAGEGASDNALCRLYAETWEKHDAAHNNGEASRAAARRALYDLGKKHQASDDAATIAGLRRVRPAVAWFAEQMEAKLRENDHKGDWSECSVGYLRDRLREECVELEMALDAKPFDVVVREAADVANFAMMIADSCRPEPGGAATPPPAEKRREAPSPLPEVLPIGTRLVDGTVTVAQVELSASSRLGDRYYVATGTHMFGAIRVDWAHWRATRSPPPSREGEA